MDLQETKVNQAWHSKTRLQPENQGREGPRGPGARRGPVEDQGSTVDPQGLQENQGNPETQASLVNLDLKGPKVFPACVLVMLRLREVHLEILDLRVLMDVLDLLD